MYSARLPNGIATFHLGIDLMLSCCFVNYSTERLSLWGNLLNGTIPTEIGQLTQLGEYSRDCCHDMLVQSLLACIPIHLVILTVVIDLMLSCCFVNYSTKEVWLDSNVLNGTIPTEIGQLKQLSEYTRDCCHDMLAQ
jgi:hypothetical protein